MTHDRIPTGLAAVDPERVELPHGCEVTLRRRMAFGDAQLPMGTIGRVTGHPTPGQVQVTIVGRGKRARTMRSRPAQGRRQHARTGAQQRLGGRARSAV